jgi:hypothetical protein
MNAFFTGFVSEIRPLTYLSWTQLILGGVFMVSVVLLSLRLRARYRWAMLYLVFVPHLAGIFFYATKNDFSLDQLIRGKGASDISMQA